MQTEGTDLASQSNETGHDTGRHEFVGWIDLVDAIAKAPGNLRVCLDHDAVGLTDDGGQASQPARR